MARKRPVSLVATTIISIALILATLATSVHVASASGGCKFCAYSPFSTPVTTNTVIAALNTGSNTNVAGPTTQSGYKALIEPQSQAYYTPTAINTYILNVSAGFKQISTTALAGPVTAAFYWNLTWYTSITTANCSPVAPFGESTLNIFTSIYNSSSSSYLTQSFLTVFDVTFNTCNSNTVYTQSTAQAYVLTYSFTAQHGTTYTFASEIYGQVEAQAANVGPASGVGITTLLNVATGYNGQFSAIQVY